MLLLSASKIAFYYSFQFEMDFYPRWISLIRMWATKQIKNNYKSMNEQMKLSIPIWFFFLGWEIDDHWLAVVVVVETFDPSSFIMIFKTRTWFSIDSRSKLGGLFWKRHKLILFLLDKCRKSTVFRILRCWIWAKNVVNSIILWPACCSVRHHILLVNCVL